MRRIVLLLLCLALVLTACAPAGGSGGEVGAAPSEAATAAPTEAAATAEAEPAEAELSEAGAASGGAEAAEAGVRIPLSALNDGILFVDCASGETAMQLLAWVNAAVEPGLAWNTCQTCAGSPAAFFALDGGQLVCQNCGNRFSLDTVGAASQGGCMPWLLSGYVVEDGEILVPQEVIDGMAGAFRNWRKGL